MDAGGGWNEGGKNRWRYKEGSDQKVIEIELNHGKIALIDAERLEDVLPHRWHVKQEKPPYEDTFYAHTAKYMGSGAKPLVKKTYMHALLYPNIAAPRDHIDRNGLNNTRANIRSGANGINTRNIRSNGRDIGVTTHPSRKSYRAGWSEANGKKTKKEFPWNAYTSKEEAYNAAVAYREEQAKRAVDEIIQAQNEGREIERYRPKPISSNTGLKNITMQYKDGNPYRVTACIQIGGKRNLRNFSAFQYGGDIDKAIIAAQEWIESLKRSPTLKRERDE